MAHIKENHDETTAAVDEAHHAPGYVYGSAEVLQLEKDTMFMRDWLCVARTEELANAGDYLTIDVIGEPIVVTRDKHMEIRAFYNQCKHRGVAVAQGCGNAKIFKCPYHAWTYDLQGKLIGAPHMQDSVGFDKSNCALKTVRVDTWQEWVFICLSPETETLAEFLKEYSAEFAFLEQGGLKLGFKYETEFDCNWKFVYENLMDIYHVGVTHINSIGKYHDPASYTYKRLPRGRVAIEYAAKTMSDTGESLFGMLPGIDDPTFARIGFLPPNLTLLARCDYVRPMLHWPVAVDKTRSIGYFLFPSEVVDAPDFKEKIKTYVKFLDEVLNEDRGMIVSLQKAMSSSGFEPGRMSIMEDSIHHVVSHHIKTVFGA